MKKTAFIIALAVSVAVLAGLAFGASDADFQKAVNHYKAGRYKEAVRVLEEYVKERPDAPAYYLMGYANYALERNELAARNFKDAYLVDPEFSPGEFRRKIGIDREAPAKAAAPAPAAPAPATPAEAQAPAPAPPPAVSEAPPAPSAPPAEAAPEAAPRSRRARPAQPPSAEQPPMGFIAALGLLPLILGLVFYFYYAVCLFLIGKKTNTAMPWLAFVPVVNVFWPLVGASGKPAWWIVLLLVPVVNLLVMIYLWMLTAERLGKSKIYGLLVALVPVVNLILLGLLAFKAKGAAPGVASRLEEFPTLPEVPGMEEKAFFEEEAPPVEEAPPMEETPPAEEVPEKEEFGDLLEETEELPEEFFEEKPGEEEEKLTPLEELPPEEEERPFEEGPLPEELEAPSEGAQPWQFPGEEPLEYEAAGPEEAGALPPLVAGAGLIGVGELFSRAFGVFKRRILTLVLITVLSFLLFLVGFGIFAGIGFALGLLLPSIKQGLVAGGVVAGVIAGLITQGWGYGALVFGVAEERLGVFDSYGRAWQKVGSFIWLYFLLFIVIIPGGLLLFLVPGILFAVWFPFAPYILAREGVRGMSAIIKSKEYVRGLFGDVFVRLLPLLAMFIVVGMMQWVLAVISVGVPVAPQIASMALSLVVTPFTMIYVYHIYTDLRRVKGDVAYSPRGGEKAKWVGLGILGWLIAPILIALLLGAAVLGTYFMFRAQLP